MEIERIKDLQEKVLYILENHPDTRNDDIQLTCMIVLKHRPKDIKEIDGQWWMTTKAMRWCREDNVKRVRAKIQNDPKNPRFLPTDPAVRKKRNIEEETWREYLGYRQE